MRCCRLQKQSVVLRSAKTLVRQDKRIVVPPNPLRGASTIWRAGLQEKGIEEATRLRTWRYVQSAIEQHPARLGAVPREHRPR